jgi:hypothetical protein
MSREYVRLHISKMLTEPVDTSQFSLYSLPHVSLLSESGVKCALKTLEDE